MELLIHIIKAILEGIFYLALGLLAVFCISVMKQASLVIYRDYKEQNKPQQQYTGYAKTYHDQVLNQLSGIIIK